MIVSHAHQFIFFHNPKCAGTSFRNTIAAYHDDEFTFWGVFRSSYFKNEIDHSHLRLWELHAQFPRLFACAESYNSVIFVRDPFARFLSAMAEHIKKFQKHVNLTLMSEDEICGTAEKFIRNSINISRITTDRRFIHFSPQIWFLKIGDRTIPRYIIPITGAGTFRKSALAVLGLPNLEIPWYNSSSVDLGILRQSPYVTKFVEGFYADDFEFFETNDLSFD